MRGVLERLERITAVRDAGIAAPRKAELILMDMEIVQLVGAVDQLPYLAAMEGRADMWTGREVVTGVAVRPACGNWAGAMLRPSATNTPF
jgi:hypothetical protein